jgi:hypothetical protein
MSAHLDDSVARLFDAPACRQIPGLQFDLIDLTVVQPDACDPRRLLMPRAIDACGQVLGNRTDCQGRDAPFVAASADRLDSFDLPAPARAAAFGGGGEIVGRWFGDLPGQAVTWIDGSVIPLQLPAPFDDEPVASFATVAYADGRIAGWLVPDDGGTIPLVWEEGQVRVLPPVGELTHGYPASMLDDGTIAGEARGADGGLYPICWRNGSAELLDTPHRYGRVLAGSCSDPAHLGSAWTGKRFEATIWRSDGYRIMPSLNGPVCESSVLGLNAAGTAVGITYRTPSRGDWVATCWQAGAAFALDDLIEPGTGVRLISANAINGAGKLAAAEFGPDGSLHAVRLDPR